MIYIKEVSHTLVGLGRRVRELRIAKGESQALFAARIGISRPTLNAIEAGAPTVQVGHWMAVWWALNRLGDMREAFESSIPAFDLLPEGPPRLRARRSRSSR